MKILKYTLLLILLALTVLLQTCKPKEQLTHAKDIIVVNDVKEQNVRDNNLNVYVNSNSTNYFIYKGLPMGYQYEILNLMAKDLDFNLNFILENSLDKGLNMLKDGEIDLLAVNLTVTEKRKKSMNFTESFLRTNQVLVQKNNSKLIRDVLDLKDKTIHVLKSSSFYERVKDLSEEIGSNIYIEVVENSNEEELMAKVASGEIDYTIVDSNTAEVNAMFYGGLNVDLRVSGSQDLAWAINKHNPSLLKEVNAWLKAFNKTKKCKVLRQKYYSSSRIGRRIKSDYFTQKTGIISNYDHLFKVKAKLINWDWKLIAAVSYQESHFNPSAKSHVGAFGLMQLMPNTAKMYDVDINSSPVENVDAGVKYLKYLEKQLMRKLDDKTDILQFTLASYNAGIGHVYDARELARKNGKNPDIWKDNVDFYLLNKSKSEYYNDPVVKYGYCRGAEPYHYVNSILNYYKHYQNLMLT